MKEDVYERIQELTDGPRRRRLHRCGGHRGHGASASFDLAWSTAPRSARFMGTDRPHVLRQAIHCCRNFGTVSVVGVYGGFLDKVPMGSAINRGLTFRMAQTPRPALPAERCCERIEEGEIDPSFVITHTRLARGGAGALQDVPRQEGRLHQGRDEARMSSSGPSNPVPSDAMKR